MFPRFLPLLPFQPFSIAKINEVLAGIKTDLPVTPTLVFSFQCILGDIVPTVYTFAQFERKGITFKRKASAFLTISRGIPDICASFKPIPSIH